MSSNPAIRISGLSKSYQIAHNDSLRPTNLGEAITQRLRNPFKRTEKETFWALKDIDLEIERGEVVGVIGRNGAGKSTLLKVLSRITEPTTGRIELFGRVGSLLEVGTGFHPELTGRENIFLNGAILGMKRSEIRRQFDEIIDFAGVEKFLDTPVKRYSSGMYVRLAFAVAAHLNPEILIVDEVLAVGDAEFQKKCLGKMQDVAQSGRTVMLVSHNMDTVIGICNRGIMLREGEIVNSGTAKEAVDFYLHSRSNVSGYWNNPTKSPNLISASIQKCSDAHSATIMSGEPIRIYITYDTNDYGPPELGVCITTDSGVRVCTASTAFADSQSELPLIGQVCCEIEGLNLVAGGYSVRLGLDAPKGLAIRINDAMGFEVIGKINAGRKSQTEVHGIIRSSSKWTPSETS